MTVMPLQEADKVEVLTILDNSVDLLMASTEHAKRFPQPPDPLTCEMLVAGHGFAALVTVSRGNTTHSFLLDAGLSKNGLMHNLDVLEIKPKELQMIVLSHGHFDHTNGLMGMIGRLGERTMPLLLHPDALLERKLVSPDGRELRLPPPDKHALANEGIEFIEERARPIYWTGWCW